MATVYKKTFTKPLPTNAETFARKGERFARWKDAKGKTRTATLTSTSSSAVTKSGCSMKSRTLATSFQPPPLDPCQTGRSKTARPSVSVVSSGPSHQ